MKKIAKKTDIIPEQTLTRDIKNTLEEAMLAIKEQVDYNDIKYINNCGVIALRSAEGLIIGNFRGRFHNGTILYKVTRNGTLLWQTQKTYYQ